MPIHLKREFERDICVLSDGEHPNKVMTVARDLGEDEIKEGVPLIGRAGSLFRLVEMDLKVESFKTNLVPFKPVNNKAFSYATSQEFKSVLLDLIDLVQPLAIITLGKEATNFFIPVSSILEAAQHSFSWSNKDEQIKIFPCAHPSYLLRNGVTLNTIKTDQKCKMLFRDLFFKNIFSAHKFVGNIT